MAFNQHNATPRQALESNIPQPTRRQWQAQASTEHSATTRLLVLHARERAHMAAFPSASQPLHVHLRTCHAREAAPGFFDAPKLVSEPLPMTAAEQAELEQQKAKAAATAAELDRAAEALRRSEQRLREGLERGTPKQLAALLMPYMTGRQHALQLPPPPRPRPPRDCRCEWEREVERRRDEAEELALAAMRTAYFVERREEREGEVRYLRGVLGERVRVIRWRKECERAWEEMSRLGKWEWMGGYAEWCGRGREDLREKEEEEDDDNDDDDDDDDDEDDDDDGKGDEEGEGEGEGDTNAGPVQEMVEIGRGTKGWAFMF